MNTNSEQEENSMHLRKGASAGAKMVRRQYFQLIPYQVLLLIVNAVNGIVDGVVSSNVIGHTAMTAIGMFAPFNHLLYAASMMLVSGSQILCGRYMGKNQGQKVKNIFTVDLVLSLAVSLAITAIMAVGAALNWTRVFAPDAVERAALNEFFLGQAIGIPGLILGQQLFAFLSMENHTRRTTAATLVCVISNSLLDVLFVSVLKMGTFGLALGTAISEWLFFGVLVMWYVKYGSGRLTLKGMDFHEARSIVVLGYPGSLSRFMEMFRCLIVNALILHYVGSTGLSSFAASNSVMAIFWALPFGMVAVDRMLLSVSIGEEDRKGTEDIMRIVTRWDAPLTLCVSILLCLAAEPLTRMFFQDPGDPVYAMTVMGLRILPFCMPLAVITLSFAVYAQTMQNKLLSTILPICEGVVFVVLFSLLLIPCMGMNGLYVANILNNIGCMMVIAAFAMARIHHIPRNLKDLLAFPDGFGADEKDYLILSVSGEKEIPTIAIQVEAFCLERGIERRKAVFSGLAMEEMAGNIFAHGFSTEHHIMEIRVTYTDDDVILRLRDNGRPFNSVEQMQMAFPEDGVKNVGMRILMESAKDVQYHIGAQLTKGIARDVQYKNVLGLNVLMIRI